MDNKDEKSRKNAYMHETLGMKEKKQHKGT